MAPLNYTVCCFIQRHNAHTVAAKATKSEGVSTDSPKGDFALLPLQVNEVFIRCQMRKLPTRFNERRLSQVSLIASDVQC